MKFKEGNSSTGSSTFIRWAFNWLTVNQCSIDSPEQQYTGFEFRFFFLRQISFLIVNRTGYTAMNTLIESGSNEWFLPFPRDLLIFVIYLVILVYITDFTTKRNNYKKVDFCSPPKVHPPYYFIKSTVLSSGLLFWEKFLGHFYSIL